MFRKYTNQKTVRYMYPDRVFSKSSDQMDARSIVYLRDVNSYSNEHLLLLKSLSNGQLDVWLAIPYF